MQAKAQNQIQKTLTWQLIILTIILISDIVLLALHELPEAFKFASGGGATEDIVHSTNTGVMICAN
jgi:hypothetical protein